MRNVNAKELKKLLSSKNITSKTDSLEVAYLASRILDKKTIKSIDDLSVAEARIFYQKLRKHSYDGKKYATGLQQRLSL